MDTSRDNDPGYKRETLYQEVWAEPVKNVATRYGISDVALAKTCRRLSIPLPGRGYWAKKRAGTAPARPPLPELSAEVKARIAWSSSLKRQPSTLMAAPRKKDSKPDTPAIRVADWLSRPHRLVAEAKESLSGPGSRQDFVSCSDKRCLDIDVSRGSIRRALLIMDALVKGLENQGYVVEVTEPRETTSHYNSPNLIPGVTRARVDDEWINFGLKEGYTRVEVHRPLEWAAEWGGYSIDRVRKPTGMFSLFISNSPSGFRTSWNDGKKQRVEDCLGAFVAYLSLISAKLRDERLEAERRHQTWLGQERRRQEVVALRREGERRMKEMHEAIGRWKTARDLRSFVSDVREAAGKMALSEAQDAVLEEKIMWALGYAARVDPIREFILPLTHAREPG